MSIVVASLVILGLIFSTRPTLANENRYAPVLRNRLGFYMLNVQAGTRVSGEALGSIATLQPTVLWDLSTFKSRVGVHFLADLGSSFGMMPISGMGFSGYFYPFGLSSSYDIGGEGTVYQKSRPGPFVVGTITPVNFNLNRAGSEMPDGDDLAFSAYMLETGLGVGYDYPFRQNTIFSFELMYRYAGAQQNQSIGKVVYSGVGAMLVMSSSYY